MKREFPSFLDPSCAEFTGRSLLVRPKGLRYYVDWIEQELDPRGHLQETDLRLTPLTFFDQDEQLNGFVGEVRTPGHPLDNFKALLRTLSDGENFNFSDNLCPIWTAAFGDSEPLVSPNGIRPFKGGRVYLGRVVVFENELHLRKLRERLDRMDPRKGTHG
jgi:hypothetical protein